MIDRTRPDRIDHAYRESATAESLCNAHAALHNWTESDDDDICPLSERLCLTNRDRLRITNRNPFNAVARIVERKRMILCERSAHERSELLLIFW